MNKEKIQRAHSLFIPVFRALVPEQLEPEHLRLLGRGAKRTGFEVGSKSFINMHKQPNISVRALRTRNGDHLMIYLLLYAVDLPCVVELVVD